MRTCENITCPNEPELDECKHPYDDVKNNECKIILPSVDVFNLNNDVTIESRRTSCTNAVDSNEVNLGCEYEIILENRMEWPYIERTSPRGMTDEEWCENSGFNGRVVDGKFICDRPVYIPNTTENYFQTEEELNNNWDVINACCRYPWCGKDDESKSKLVGVQN